MSLAPMLILRGHVSPLGYDVVAVLNPEPAGLRRWQAEVMADVAALHLRAGDALLVTEQSRIDCDCLYQLHGNTFARIQHWTSGVRLVLETGHIEFMPKPAAEALVCGRVRRVVKGGAV